MGQGEINGEGAAGGITDDDGATDIEVIEQREEIFGGSETSFGLLGMAVAAAVVAYRVIFFAERGPGAVPGVGMQQAIVQQNHGGTGAAFFVIDFCIGDLEILAGGSRRGSGILGVEDLRE